MIIIYIYNVNSKRKEIKKEITFKYIIKYQLKRNKIHMIPLPARDKSNHTQTHTHTHTHKIQMQFANEMYL